MSEMQWTPYVIKVILHHYTSPTKYERDDLPLYRETAEELAAQGIMNPNEFGYFDVTPKGQALVKAWCTTPAPVAKWMDPRFETAL